MFIYVKDDLSVDEAKAIATQLFAIAYDNEEAESKANCINPLAGVEPATV